MFTFLISFSLPVSSFSSYHLPVVSMLSTHARFNLFENKNSYHNLHPNTPLSVAQLQVSTRSYPFANLLFYFLECIYQLEAACQGFRLFLFNSITISFSFLTFFFSFFVFFFFFGESFFYHHCIFLALIFFYFSC